MGALVAETRTLLGDDELLGYDQEIQKDKLLTSRSLSCKNGPLGVTPESTLNIRKTHFKQAGGSGVIL